MFPEYKKLDLVQTGKEIGDFWELNDIFKKSLDLRSHTPRFNFYEGPPSANGTPGIHHVLARAIKDVICRYKAQQGRYVERKAGWDTHGLPIELSVEKELGITKEDIGTKISIEEYNRKCRETVMRYTDQWEALTTQMGYWVDINDPYITYTNKYIETVWHLLSQVYKQGWLYKGYTIQPYSPKAGTGLSSHELNQPGCYRMVKDTSVVAQFKVRNEDAPAVLNPYITNLYILAWTTTPWTLSSNAALTVNRKIKYSIVHTYNQYTAEQMHAIVATDRVGALFTKPYTEVEGDILPPYPEDKKNIPYRIVDTINGEDMLGTRYEQLLPYVPPAYDAERAFVVIHGDFVTTEEGTGVVHTAPTFGADDALVSKQNGVPPIMVKNAEGDLIPLVDKEGRYVDEMGEFGGAYVKNEYYADDQRPEKSTDVRLAIKLKTENKAFRVELYEHSYPHCWRTQKPVLYYPLDSWFIKTTAVRERLIENNQKIFWKPESIKEGRFGKWLENLQDWNLSRSRYWGIPLPIWRTEDQSEEVIISSFEELKEKIEEAIDKGYMKENFMSSFEPSDMSDTNYDTFDVHRPYIDAVVLVSGTGKPMYRETDIIDVWFDSGSMPYAQLHYPFENREQIENGDAYPAHFIAEGIDQTRGWFFTLHAIGSLVFDSPAYTSVISNGLVLDSEGRKMSKSLGNALDPFEVMNTYSADAVRWYSFVSTSPWDNIKFSTSELEKVNRKFFGTLHNTYSFFALYANIDNFTYAEIEISIEEKPEFDRWITSELHSLIKEYTDYMESYELTKAVRSLEYFVCETLSNWYVRLNRRRFWKGEPSHDKASAYQTLYTCLATISKLLAPFCPFYADKIYRSLDQTTRREEKESVHLTDLPVSDSALIDTSLQNKMSVAQRITSTILAIRKKERIKVRQPLSKALVAVSTAQQLRDGEEMKHIIIAETNLKALDILPLDSDLLRKNAKPNFKTLGPKFGKNLKVVVSEIAQLTDDKIQEAETEKSIILNTSIGEVAIEYSDLIITTKDIEGYVVESKEGTTIALDMHINDELHSEGLARELVNRIQNQRKSSGLEVTDRIVMHVEADEELKKAIERNQTFIREEVLADQICFEKPVKQAVEYQIDNYSIHIELHKTA